MLDVVVFLQVGSVSVPALQADEADGTGQSKVLGRRLIITSHKALMHDVGKLEVLCFSASEVEHGVRNPRRSLSASTRARVLGTWSQKWSSQSNIVTNLANS